MKITKSQLRKTVRKLINEQAKWQAISPMNSEPVTYEEGDKYYQLAVKTYDSNHLDHNVIDAFGGKDEYIQRIANAAEHDLLRGGYGGVSLSTHNWVVLTMVRKRV